MNFQNGSPTPTCRLQFSGIASAHECEPCISCNESLQRCLGAIGHHTRTRYLQHSCNMAQIMRIQLQTTIEAHKASLVQLPSRCLYILHLPIPHIVHYLHLPTLVFFLRNSELGFGAKLSYKMSRKEIVQLLRKCK